jgi:hypothetical protein
MLSAHKFRVTKERHTRRGRKGHIAVAVSAGSISGTSTNTSASDSAVAVVIAVAAVLTVLVVLVFVFRLVAEHGGQTDTSTFNFHLNQILQRRRYTNSTHTPSQWQVDDNG